jgi:RHS repeat-associated protein
VYILASGTDFTYDCAGGDASLLTWYVNPGASIGNAAYSVKIADEIDYTQFCSNAPKTPVTNIYTLTVTDGTTANPGFNLSMDFSAQTYSIGLLNQVDGAKEVYNATGICGSPARSDVTNPDWGPLTDGAQITNVPIPASGSVLVGSVTYKAPSYDGESDVTWILSWDLKPTQDDTTDTDCHATGSDIGCLNQTLGENIPIVGTPFYLRYQSDRSRGRNDADPVAIQHARDLGGWTLNVHHAFEPFSAGCWSSPFGCSSAVIPKALFLGDGSSRSFATIQAPVYSNGNTYVTSEDGSDVYVFGNGLHVQTVRPLSGATLYTFGYDANGRIARVTDSAGNVTSIQRDGLGNPTAIVSPYGQSTSLMTDANGYLIQVTDPAGNTIKLTNSSQGLLTSMTDANGNTSQFQYDGLGMLLKDSDAAGGSTTLERTDTVAGYSVKKTTAVGRTSIYDAGFMTGSSTAQNFVNTWPSGLQASRSDAQQTGGLSESASLPDGSSSSSMLTPDPRWGIQAPLSSTTLTVGSLTMNSASTRAVNLANPGDPFSLISQTDNNSINGRNYTTTYTASGRTLTMTSPVGRQATITLDSLERIVSEQAGSWLPANSTYDQQGRPSTVTLGTRQTTYAYDANGFLSSVTDPLNLTTAYQRDQDGRPASVTFPDGRIVGYSYDAAGNLTGVTSPGGGANHFAYTPVNQIARYDPPAIDGAGATTFTYDADRNLTGVNRPDGQLIGFSYDRAGRLSGIAAPSGTTNFTYDSTTGNLASATTDKEQVAYGYIGSLLTSSTWTGLIQGNVSLTYGNNFWTTGLSINGENTVAYTYDDDGLITGAGPLAITQSADNGQIAATTLGVAADSRSYNDFGELIGYTASVNGAPVYDVEFTRDDNGRIAAKQETIDGQTTVYGYSYDLAGRLVAVTGNAGKTSYIYDQDSNRLSATTPAGSTNGVYDVQDRLLSYGGATYAYSANGELASKATGAQLTAYHYDVHGNLLSVTLPEGLSISYIVDPENRRIGKIVNGALTAGYLYDGHRLVAQLDPSGTVVSQFVYGTHDNTPDFMVHGGITYRIFSDHLGSPRLIVDASSALIAERIDYDEFGNITNDTSPGFQPFGFGGGLYDQDTKLVRFGARDYDPTIGRWTAKDPILFAGRDTNLYRYTSGDPINRIDTTGFDDRFRDYDPLAFMGVIHGYDVFHYIQPVAPVCGCEQNFIISALIRREISFWVQKEYAEVSEYPKEYILNQIHSLATQFSNYKFSFDNAHCHPETPPGYTPPRRTRGVDIPAASSSGIAARA